jgi:hypothetical protein
VNLRLLLTQFRAFFAQRTIGTIVGQITGLVGALKAAEAVLEARRNAQAGEIARREAEFRAFQQIAQRESAALYDEQRRSAALRQNLESLLEAK